LAASIPLLAKADELFEKGDFSKADTLYRKVLARDPHNVHALAQHAYIVLLTNKVQEAKTLLKQVLRLDPKHTRSLGNLADALWRADEFEELAAFLPLPDDIGPPATAAQLRSFAGRRPYQISGSRSTRIPFVASDPLPLIEVSLNGAVPEVFFIDTGGAFALNEGYAKKIGVPMYGYTTGRTMYGDHRIYQAPGASLNLLPGDRFTHNDLARSFAIEAILAQPLDLHQSLPHGVDPDSGGAGVRVDEHRARADDAGPHLDQAVQGRAVQPDQVPCAR
jgi:tetratricopeptide (TPR) repeat protein